MTQLMYDQALAGPNQSAALTANGLMVRFGGLVAVNRVSFDIPLGGIVSLIGPNGAGKTTFFNALTGLYQLAEGAVFLGDRDITGMPPHKIAGLGVARTFQNIRLFGLMTAEENIKVAMHGHLRSGVFSTIFRAPWQRREEKRAHDDALDLLEFVGISGSSWRVRAQPLLRRPAPAGGGPGAGAQAERAAARRTDRRHEPA